MHWLANRAQVHRDPRTGRAIRIVGVAMDLTDRKLAEQRIAHMAHHDALTGLPNRVLLRDRIQQAIAQAHRNGSQLAVLFIDRKEYTDAPPEIVRVVARLRVARRPSPAGPPLTATSARRRRSRRR